MPYQRLTYEQLTGRINVLSELCAHLQSGHYSNRIAEQQRTIVLGHIKHEIDRLENHRRKVKAHGQQVHDTGRLQTNA